MNENTSVYEKPIVYQIPGMDHITVHCNLIYKNVRGIDLKLDRSPQIIAQTIKFIKTNLMVKKL
jgi:hypothetical protein